MPVFVRFCHVLSGKAPRPCTKTILGQHQQYEEDVVTESMPTLHRWRLQNASLHQYQPETVHTANEAAVFVVMECILVQWLEEWNLMRELQVQGH